MAHTPTPWEAEPNAGRGSWIKGAGGEWTALSCGDSDLSARDNARLIVTAVNSHEAMREALKRALPYVELAYDEEGGEEAAEAKRDLDFCRAALAKARAAKAEG